MLTWCVCFCTLPVVFAVDDIRAGPFERLSHVIPQLYPMMVYVHLLMGGIHGALPADPDDLARLLTMQTWLFVLRCFNLAWMSGLWSESIRAGAVVILPTTLGFHASRSLIPSGGRDLADSATDVPSTAP